MCFSFCLLKMLTDGLEWCGLLVDYCDVFIRCLDSHYDGTHSLQSIHCWNSDAMLHFSKSDEETNSSTSWLTWDWRCFQRKMSQDSWNYINVRIKTQTLKVSVTSSPVITLGLKDEGLSVANYYNHCCVLKLSWMHLWNFLVCASWVITDNCRNHG